MPELNLPRVLFDIDDLPPEHVTAILSRAAELADGRTPPRALEGRIVALCFWQPSTRTRIGFAAAVARLGGSVVEVTGTKYQDGMDGPESIADTARVLDDYCATLIIRHPSDTVVREMAQAADAPVINAGAGRIAHPTQALIDLHAICRRFGRLDGLRVGIAGDLSTSRTGRSFFKALLPFSPNEIRLMAPADRHWSELPMASSAVPVTRINELKLDGLDVLYVAGMPPGAGEHQLSVETRRRFFIDRGRMAELPLKAIVLCALPRTGDIDPAVDGDVRSQYFQESADGLFVRTALMEGYAARAAA